MNTYKGLISKQAACLATVSVVYQLVLFFQSLMYLVVFTMHMVRQVTPRQRKQIKRQNQESHINIS